MKKIFVIMLTILTFSLIATGCTKSKSYTFKVETGDNVKVTLKTNDEYTYYMIIWINEINQDQTDKSNTFYGKIEFSSSNGTGVTSAF